MQLKYIISMSKFYGTAADLNDLVNAMEKPGILLLEDLDTANVEDRQMISIAANIAGSDKKDTTLAALVAENQSLDQTQ
jgi:hypothetical protein